MLAVVSSQSMDVTVGGPGGARGVTLTAEDGPLDPTALSARRVTDWDVPLGSPVIVTGLVLSGGDRAVQLVPSREYS